MADLQRLYDNLQAQLKQIEALGVNPQYSQLLNPQAVSAPTPVQTQQQVPQQSPASETSLPTPLNGQQELLLTMYDEFALTDDGKALAANLTKFARWVQSKVAKSS